jgi:tol-pal system protein YbgF
MKSCAPVLAATLAVLISQGIHAQTQLSIPVEDKSPMIRDAPLEQAPRQQPATYAEPASTPVMRPPSNASAELLMLLDQLQEEVRSLRGLLEEQSHQFNKMRTNQRDRYRDLDRRISRLGSKQAASAQSRPTTADSTPTLLPPNIKPNQTPQPPTKAQPSSTTATDDRQVFKQAFSLVRQNEYDAALGAFDQFIARYPDSPLLPNAYYWVGEVHRAKTIPDYAKAETAYREVIERFPDNSKAPDALYKLGLTLEALNQTTQAQAIMNSVIQRYPDTASARLARDYQNAQQ